MLTVAVLVPASCVAPAGSGFVRIRPNCSSPSGSKSARMGTMKVRFDWPGPKESVAAETV